MFKTARPVYYYVLSPLHAGSGSDVGFVDLPIQRERHTGFPKIESSGLKGSFRESFENQLKDTEEKVKIHIAFGYDNDEKNETIKKRFGQNTQYLGALGFSDARILLFPVKSVKGVFAWVTCPYVLKRYLEEMGYTNKKGVEAAFTVPRPDTVTPDTNLLIKNERVILEEYAFEVQTDETCKKIADYLISETGISEIREKIIILKDDDFRDFVELSTDIITRTKIDTKTGTVKGTALWTEEYLPAETVMYSLVFSSGIYSHLREDFYKGDENLNDEEKVMNFFTKNLSEYMQIGGNATTGKGMVRIKVAEV